MVAGNCSSLSDHSDYSSLTLSSFFLSFLPTKNTGNVWGDFEGLI